MSCNCKRTVLKGDKGDTGREAPTSYLVYTALLTQTGTDAPIVVSNGSGANTPLQNTLGGTPVWTYVSTGRYRITLASAFAANKTVVIIGPILAVNVEYTFEIESTSAIRINTSNSSVLANALLDATLIEIRVYP